MNKLWRKITVDYRLTSSTSIVVEYSKDEGTTWTALPTISYVDGVRKKTDLKIDATSVSIKLRFTMRGANQNSAPQLFGFVVSYLPLPEPNWMWTFTIVLSKRNQLMDGTFETLDTEAEIAFLNALYRTKALITFIDAEGVQWSTGGQPGVLIYDMTVNLMDLVQPLEGEVQVTVLEAVETF